MEGIVALIVVGIFIVLLFYFLIIFPIKLFKHKKYMESVIYNLNPNSANELMAFVKRNGCPNYPDNWNQLRGAFNAINNCPLITTEDKTKLRDFLMVKGLRLTGYDKNINDNYGKQQTKKTTH